MSKSRFIAAIVFLSVLVGATRLLAADERRARALSLAGEGRCEVALTELIALRSGDPPDADVERLIGECALRLQKFELAAQAFEAARVADPQAPRVDLHLAMARFHLGQIDAAAAAIRAAESADTSVAGSPEFLLYSGLIALDRDEYRVAAGRFDAASRLSDRAPQPMAAFYLGRALTELDDAAAQTAFEGVIRDYPGTSWAEEANRSLERLKSESAVRYWATAEVGFEHDDNAILRGRDVGLPQEISGQSDQRGFWFADLGASRKLAHDFSGGVAIRYAGSAHDDLKDFDTHAPGGTVWLDRSIGAAGDALRLQYDIDAAFIDNDPFVTNHLVRGSYFRPWDDFGETVFSMTFGHDFYSYDRFDVPDGAGAPTFACIFPDTLCGPNGLDEKRATNPTGNAVGATIVHRLPLPFEFGFASDPWLRGGYGYQRFWARGSEYDRQRHQIELEVGVELPFLVSMNVGGRFAYIAFDHATVFPDPSVVISARQYELRSRHRREQETGIWVRFQRPLTDTVMLSASYRRTRNRSNADVFDYDRNLYGISLRMSFGG